MSADRNVRRRLEQFVANTRCEANVLSAVHDVSMARVAREEGGRGAEGQSRFALARGAQFERGLFEDGAALLRDGLKRAGVFTAGAPTVHDLRLRSSGGPMPNLDAACDAFQRFLTARTHQDGEALVIAPAMRLPGRALLPEGMFAIDVLTVHPAPEGSRDARTTLRIGEIKVYPDRGGHTDPGDLAAARAQAGLYVHVLRVTLAALGLAEDYLVADDGFLVLSSPRSNRPSVRAGEDLRWQARRAAAAFEKLLAAAALPALPSAPAARLRAVRGAPTDYSESCLGFCPRAPVCRERALAAGDPAALGREVVHLLGNVRLERALELLDGHERPRDDAESALLQRLAAATTARSR